MKGYNPDLFTIFFAAPEASANLEAAIRLALDDDGPDLTSNAIFPPDSRSVAVLVCKEEGGSIVAGLPLIPLILRQAASAYANPDSAGLKALAPDEFAFDFTWQGLEAEGSHVPQGAEVASVEGETRLLLKAERVILNFITHMSGIANLTARYAAALDDLRYNTHSNASGPYKRRTRLLDTRKTLPGLRYPEKYAVLLGGGENHRLNLSDMLMLKDNHIDAAGSITAAVGLVLRAYSPCPPIEVECRTLDEVREAIAVHAAFSTAKSPSYRIMLDNMDEAELKAALALIPQTIESEISGGISLDNLSRLRALHPEAPDFVSVGRLTHSAPAADFSLRITHKRGEHV